MYAVGIDVSNGKSTVAVLRSKVQKNVKPFEVTHTAESLKHLAEKLNSLDSDVRIVMEHTGRYYESVAQFLHGAGFFVSALNPLLIREYSDGKLHRVKTDKADAVKIARFAIDNWVNRVEIPLGFQIAFGDRDGQIENLNAAPCVNILPWIRFAISSKR